VKVRALVANGVGLALACVVAAACGGRVDNLSSSGPGTSSTADPVPQLPPPSTGRPGRPPPGPVSAASVASEIAETYCKSFSGCCVSAGQPPIDVARCRQLVAADVEASVDPNTLLGVEEVANCIDTIKGRVAVCSAVDAQWWSTSKVPLLAPGTVTQACASVFGFASGTPKVCTSDVACNGLANTCAIDQCVPAVPLGASCASSSCLDGALCVGGTCSALPDVMPKGSCATDDDCRLGLVCAKSVCLPSRDFPELARPRFSPYRIGADTCRAYTFL
jgi:hypothetical protein